LLILFLVRHGSPEMQGQGDGQSVCITSSVECCSELQLSHYVAQSWIVQQVQNIFFCSDSIKGIFFCSDSIKGISYEQNYGFLFSCSDAPICCFERPFERKLLLRAVS